MFSPRSPTPHPQPSPTEEDGSDAKPKTTAPDGGWGWVAVFGSFMISFTCDGFAYTTGIFYENFFKIYGESAAVTAIFDSMMTGLINASGPIASGLSQAYGCRTVAIIGSVLATAGMLISIALDSIIGHILSLGAITGLGLGLLYLPQVIILTYWFDKRLACATGFAVSGSGIGIAVFAVLTEQLIHHYGWKGTMLLLSGLMFTNIFFSALFRKVGHIQEKNSLKAALGEAFNFRILGEVLFLYYLVVNFMLGTVYYVPVIFLKDHVIKSGIGKDREAMFLMVAFGLANAFGRVLFGVIGDSPYMNRFFLFAFSVITYGAAVGVIAAFGNHFLVVTIGYIVFGATEGAFVCLSSVVPVDLFGVHRVSNAFGLTNLVVGIASFLGPPLIGKTVDEKKGYTTGYWISSVITVISGVLLLFLPCIQRKYKMKD